MPGMVTGVRLSLLSLAVGPWVLWALIPTQAPKKPQPTPKPANAAVAKLDFNKDVRPILAEYCWPCHGTDQAALARTGGLRLDNFAGATADRGGGRRALVPGSPAQSLMWQRITMKETALQMPPVQPGIKPLPTEAKRILHRWIMEGGEYRPHWAFLAPKKPTPPKVDDPAWAANPIDRFVYATLRENGLKPAPPADRRTLIRRVTLSLTGLPPTPEEINAFLNDKNPGAYERVVDRLLASPRYGEHKARFWLDAVRYADTHGLHIDNERSVFPYRDWVVRALNQDLPYDQFTIWQLAGDLLPNPTVDQKIATGYIRMNPTTNEGGVIEAEFLAKNTMDRADTTATVWMGLTAACAKCHDHKYDPISIHEYYGLYAFFNSTADPVLDGNLRLHGPVMPAPTPEQQEALARVNAELTKLEDAVPTDTALAFVRDRNQGLPKDLKWEISGPYPDATFEAAFDRPLPGADAAWRSIRFSLNTATPGVVGRERASAFLRTTLERKEDGKLTFRLGSDDGLRLFIDGKPVLERRTMRGVQADSDTVTLDLAAGKREIVVHLVNAGGPDGLYLGLGDAVARRVGDVAAALAKDPKPTDLRRAAGLYLELGPDTAEAKHYRDGISVRAKLEAEVPMTYIAQELPTPRPTRVLRRGEYNLPGDFVRRMVPRAVGALPAGAPQNRLGLAQWLVNGRNPLTARVFVNRTWQDHFGTGIVKSSEDFGNRGDWPSHPELLDWLAVTFVEDGWSIKKLHRRIVTSQAFRQSAAADAAKRAKDPENRLISRGPRFRLDAEVLRDSALAASGLLVSRMGGRGDKPYQPPGLWEAIAYPISDTARYVQDKGDGLHRRSLYMFWKRTSPPATLTIFDAPSREACQVRRSRTNTPLQALATLNDPQFVEAARAMAQRVLLARAKDEDRLALAFELATGRLPTARETQILRESLDQKRAAFGSVEAATGLLAVGDSPRDAALDAREHAAWTLVCSILLNTDEFLTQH